MKRNLYKSIESSPKHNKKKARGEESETASNGGCTPSGSVKTSGGISKRLLTPCRRMGLSKTRDKGKPLRVFANDEEQEPQSDMKGKEYTSIHNGNNKKDSKSNKLIDSTSKSNLRKSNSKKCITKQMIPEESYTSDSQNIPSEPIDIFIREPASSDSDIASQLQIVPSPVKKTPGNKNKKPMKKTSKPDTKTVSTLQVHVVEVHREDVSVVKKSSDPKVVPKLVLHKVATMAEPQNKWSVTTPVTQAANTDDKENIGEINHELVEDANLINNVSKVEKTRVNSVSKEIKNNITSSKTLLKEDVEIEENKPSIEIINRPKIAVVKLVKKSLTLGESKKQNDTDKNDSGRKCSSTGNTPKKSTNKIDKRIVNSDVKNGFVSTNNSVEENILSVESSSQSSLYSYQSDDDREDGTILVRKNYLRKKSKLQLSKSSTSLEKAMTPKDIDQIQERIKQKELTLQMINVSPRRRSSETELRELIKAWRGGCQKGLEELLELSKERGTMNGNTDMEDLLRALQIPHDLVKYDPDQMIFE